MQVFFYIFDDFNIKFNLKFKYIAMWNFEESQNWFNKLYIYFIYSENWLKKLWIN